MWSAGVARDEDAPARSLRNKQWTAFGVFRERLQAALQEEYPDTTAGCVQVMGASRHDCSDRPAARALMAVWLIRWLHKR